MQILISFRKILASSLLLIGSVSAEPIGEIIEYKGSAGLQRDGESSVVSANTEPDVLMYDTAQTQNGRMKIEFKGEERLDLTEHSKVWIDEVYYDPDPSKSKMAIRMAQGTARFASGFGGKIKKSNIKVSTPTAQIAVVGTDFTTSIDEIGRSLVILLPDKFGNPSGKIIVSNAGGSVTLEEAYQATMVSTFDDSPTKPVTVNGVDASMIDNMFIVNPPEEVQEQVAEESSNNENDSSNILDVDFLEFNDLETDYLAKDELEFTELDVDFLDVDFLVDLLDVVEELVRTTASLADVQANQGGGQFTLKNAEVGFNKDSQYNIFEQDGDVIFYRNVNGSIRLAFDIGASASIDTLVEGYEGQILLNGGGDIIVVISQQN